MQIKTKEFKEVVNKILLAADLDKTAANLEIKAKGTSLYLTVTNRAEYYVSVKFNLELLQLMSLIFLLIKQLLKLKLVNLIIS